MNELEQNYLVHHGILGQRWHKRNGPPYPLDAGDHSKSEKEAGYKKSLGGGRNEELYDRKEEKLKNIAKKHRVSEKEAKKLVELEAKDPQKFHDAVNRNKAVRKFYSKSPERKELTDAMISEVRRKARMNAEANRRGREAVGGKEFSKLIEMGDGESIAKYMEAGKKYAQSEEVINEYKKSRERLDKAQLAYEKKGREFVNELLGEYGKLESKNPMSISYDIKTGKISQQTLADRVGYELYRGAGGQPRKR